MKKRWQVFNGVFIWGHVQPFFKTIQSNYPKLLLDATATQNEILELLLDQLCFEI